MYYEFQHKFISFNRKDEKRHAFTFDAFITYSHADIDRVLKFYKKLQSFGHKISFDKYDFLVGAYISENICQAFRQSHKVYFIVTEIFLESALGEFELEVARSYSFDNDRYNMNIVVLKDDFEGDMVQNTLYQMAYK